MPIRNYAEASFFDGFHFSHIADWLEHLRLKRIGHHWTNSITNVDLREALCWCEPEESAATAPPVTLGQLIREYAEANNIPIIDVKTTEEPTKLYTFEP